MRGGDDDKIRQITGGKWLVDDPTKSIRLDDRERNIRKWPKTICYIDYLAKTRRLCVKNDTS